MGGWGMVQDDIRPMNPLFDPARIKALLASLDPVSGQPSPDNAATAPALGGLFGSLMAQPTTPLANGLDQEGPPDQFPLSYQMRAQAYLDAIRRAQPQPARLKQPGALDFLLQSLGRR